VHLAPLANMWNHYPIGTKEEVAVLVGGDAGKNITKNDWETCCIRLSRSLNMSGRPITGFSAMKNPYMNGPDARVRAKKGAGSDWYIYSCYDLHVYLTARFGHPRRFGSYKQESLSGVKGIIMFAFRHVDLWNGSVVRYNTDFTDGKKTVHDIFVWKTPS